MLGTPLWYCSMFLALTAQMDYKLLEIKDQIKFRTVFGSLPRPLPLFCYFLLLDFRAEREQGQGSSANIRSLSSSVHRVYSLPLRGRPKLHQEPESPFSVQCINLLIKWVSFRSKVGHSGRILIRKEVVGPLTHETWGSEFSDLFKASFTRHAFTCYFGYTMQEER